MKSCRTCYFAEKIGKYRKASRWSPEQLPEYRCQLKYAQQEQQPWETYEECAKYCKYYEEDFH